jgi:hypothetical protein
MSSAILLHLPDRLTLGWEHTVEKTRWEEDYVVRGRRLDLREARVKGTGAGMEMPAAAAFRDGAWHYRPALHLIDRVTIRNSLYPRGYDLCWAGHCRRLERLIGPRDDLLVLAPCAAPKREQ